MRWIELSWPLLALAILLQSGCGGGDGRIAVTGSVTIDDKPLDGATIAFIGGGGGALATGSTDKNGNFRVLVAPGINKVTVSKEDASKAGQAAATPESETLMGTDAQYREQQKSMPKQLVPSKYTKPDTSGLSFEVSDGMQPLSIKLTSK